MTCDVWLPQGCSFRRVSLQSPPRTRSKARIGPNLQTTQTTSQDGKISNSQLVAFVFAYTDISSALGRQTSHTAAARSPPEQIHRHWARRHHQARVDLQHYARLIRLVPRPPEHAALHERGHGHERGSCAPSLHGKHGTAGWATTSDGR